MFDIGIHEEIYWMEEQEGEGGKGKGKEEIDSTNRNESVH